MCTSEELMKRMENYQGDLTDIVRVISGGGASSASAEWQIPINQPITYSSPNPLEDSQGPFPRFGDPLLPDIDAPGFNVENISRTTTSRGGSVLAEHHEMLKRPVFTSPNINIAKVQVPPRNIIDHHTLVSPNSSSPSPSPGPVQISSPRNTGIKRRKSQAKKVISVPAPTPANNKPMSGEVVPSDLWAWRKYGQKPIKGSPYPRGYYRCSSSKGCLARKQVERSRINPNMLMITYTSEHNHPWPTQRNALAGSTRSSHHHHSTKNTTATNTAKPGDDQSQKPLTSPPKEEQDKEILSTDTPTNPASVKLEERDQDLEQEFLQSYKPTFLENGEDNFFAELGEIEADDPLDLMLFTQGGLLPADIGDDEEIDKDLDPFSFYDWAGTTSSSTATSHHNAAKRNS